MKASEKKMLVTHCEGRQGIQVADQGRCEVKEENTNSQTRKEKVKKPSKEKKHEAKESKAFEKKEDKKEKKKGK